jgi:hypothetical protein
MSGLDVDRDKVATDLGAFGSPHSFMTKNQSVICRGCGIDNFRDHMVSALKHMESLDVTTNPRHV